MSESDSWSSLRLSLLKEAESFGKAAHIVRIENLVSSGVFDTNICFDGKEIWLEGKFLDSLPKRASTLVKVGKGGFSDKQEAFATRRLLAGGIVDIWLHIAVKGGHPANGWYHIPLTSVDLIRAARAGMTLKELDSFKCLNLSDISRRILRLSLHDYAEQIKCFRSRSEKDIRWPLYSKNTTAGSQICPK